jgi:hypothetical protein
MKAYSTDIANTAVIRMVDFCNEINHILEFQNTGLLDQQNNSAVFMLCPGGTRVKEFCMQQFRCSCYRASLIYSFKYNQQDETLYNILYYCCYR